MNTEVNRFKVFFRPESAIVEMQWKGYFTSEQFRHGTNEMLKVLKENKSGKVLADIKEMVLIAEEDQRWLENNFLPGAVQNGFKACAIISPDSHFGKVAIEGISHRLDQKKMFVRLFAKREEAEKWLLELS